MSTWIADNTQTPLADRPIARVALIVNLVGDLQATTACLESLTRLDQASYPHDLVLVDNASIGLRSILDQCEQARIVRLEARVSSLQALRSGIRATDSGMVVCLPAPACVASDALTLLCVALDRAAATTSVDTNASQTHPATAKAIALRSSSMPDIDVPDELTMGALCFELARTGPVLACPTAEVYRPALPPYRQLPRGPDIDVSVIIPTLDATSPTVIGCIANMQATLEVPYELIVLDNGAPPQGFTAPVNAGLRAARGRHLVVVNDDVEVLDGWWEPLAQALDAGAQLVFPLTLDDYMQEFQRWGCEFPGWCFAIGRDTFARMTVEPGEFFDPAMTVWYQDTDLSLRLSSIGAQPLCVPASRIRHRLHQTASLTHEDTAFNAWIRGRISSDSAYFHLKHPDYPRGDLPGITPDHAPIVLAREPVTLRTAQPGWQEATLRWPDGVGHFFLTGQLTTDRPLEELRTQAVFAGEDGAELFWMSLIPRWLKTWSGSFFCLPRERTGAVTVTGRPSPSWSTVK
ncbi:MAG TPA: glycosyltransferase, partial [Solirubrobacteraceae bacterium]|nr:glycosyltransferase [Solirubrobacteraceae bacterium]